MSKYKFELALFFCCSILVSIFVYQRIGVQAQLEEDILRFHVIANSDKEYDQELKLKVKDAILEEMQGYVQDATNQKEAKAEILKHTEDYLHTAREIILENGYDYEVYTTIGPCYFPIKEYGNIVLPAGEYEAVRIVIGDGKGKNWWCMLFPSLCFLNETNEVKREEGMEQIKENLSEEEFMAIWQDPDTTVGCHFYFIEKLAEWFR